jgi:hypothetical protein
VGIARRSIEEDDLIVTVWDGPVTPDEWTGFTGRHLTDPGARVATRRLTDVRTADTSQITFDDVESNTETNSSSEVRLAGVRLAIVAQHGWGIAHLVEVSMYKLGVTTVVFNDVHSACAWLALDRSVALRVIHELRQELRVPADGP